MAEFQSWTEEQKAKQRERYRKYREANPVTEEQRIKSRERCRRWRENNPTGPSLASKKYRKNNPGYINPKARENRRKVNEIKSNPCMDCGNSFPTVCMDFDHRDKTEKYNNVGTMVAHNYSWELIEAEISKCDLVCSNCHRIRTWGKESNDELASI